MTRRAINRTVSTVALKAAYQAKDEEKVMRLLGYSYAELVIVNHRLDRARKAIFEKFPRIGQLVNGQLQTSCTSSPSLERCSTEQFFDGLSTFRGEEEMEPEVTCDYGPYIAALALYSLLGPDGIGLVHVLPCVASVEVDGLTRSAHVSGELEVKTVPQLSEVIGKNRVGGRTGAASEVLSGSIFSSSLFSHSAKMRCHH